MYTLRILALLITLMGVVLPASAEVPLESPAFWLSVEVGVYSTGMVWRDCDLDGYVDGFFANGNDMALARNYVYISDEGVLPTVATWESSDQKYSGHCAVGDFDDNGFPDMAVANYIGTGGFSTAELSGIYYNEGGLLDTNQGWMTDSMYSFSCSMGDVDGDGDLDLAFATGDGYTNVLTPERVYINNDGVFGSSPGWLSAAHTSALDVAWGDVDRDGDLDIAFCYDNRPTSVYYNHAGVLELDPSWQSRATYSGNTLIWGDVSGDGWLDLVVAYNSQLVSGGYFQAYLNDGTGLIDSLPFWHSSDGGYGSALAMYDYDGDGDDDLAAGRWFDEPRIYENIGGTFTTTPVWRAEFSVVVEELAWVDIDGDGVEAFSDTIAGDGSLSLFYSERHPLHSLDSVIVDGTALALTEYCFDPFYGWVSLAEPPLESVVIHYQHSYKCDLTVSNWGGANAAWQNSTPTRCCGIFTGGFTGNTNCSEDGKLSLSDITQLIDRVYISKQQLCCDESGNTNGDEEGLLTLSDITRLIDAVYISKTPPEHCR